MAHFPFITPAKKGPINLIKNTNKLSFDGAKPFIELSEYSSGKQKTMNFNSSVTKFSYDNLQHDQN